MTAPGGDHDEANPAPEQPDQHAPWTPPSSDSPPPGYPPPGYPPEYQPGHPSDYPPPMPPGFGPPPPPGAPYPAGGYGPPSHPGGYYPPPDHPGGYGPAAQPGMNPLAIASLISSFAGVLCCVGSVAGIVLGTVALEQIKRSRQEGYGLAVAGIAIGVAGLVVTLVVVIFAMNSR